MVMRAQLTILTLNLIVPDEQNLALNSDSRAAQHVALLRGCVGLPRPTPTLHHLFCYLQQSMQRATGSAKLLPPRRVYQFQLPSAYRTAK